MNDSADNKNDKKEEKKYIVTRPQKVVSEYGYDPSLARYLLSRLFFPILLCPFLMLIQGGWIFIPIILFSVIGTAVYKYYELYPKSRPATESEIRVYKLMKMREAIKAKDRYDAHISTVDEFGWYKDRGDRYSDKTIKTINLYEFDENEIPDWFWKDKKRKETKFREEIKKGFSEMEEEYGPNWYEICKKEVENSGLWNVN